MIMNRMLLIAWCIDLTGLLGFQAELASRSLTQLEDFDLKRPTIKTNSTTLLPGIMSTTEDQHETQNSYKNEHGFRIFESYDSQTQKSSTVPDTQLLYHSLKNPLFKSDNLKVKPHGDIQKISSPFQSNWIFSPSSGKSVEKRSKDLNSNALFKNDSSQDTSIKLPLRNFSLNFSDNFTLVNANFTSGLDKNSSFLSSFPSFKKFEKFDNVEPNFLGTATSTVKPKNAQKSFFGYNIKEVTANGKTHGTVHVFGKDDPKDDEEFKKLDANITTPSRNRTPETTKKEQLQNKTTTRPGNGITTTSTAVIGKSPSTIVTPTPTHSSEYPRHIIIEDIQPVRASSFDQPIARDFDTPEFILYNFLEQLQNIPYIPTDNYDKNSSFDELVSENTYIYKKK